MTTERSRGLGLLKILIASKRPAYPSFLGGAEISIHEMALSFAELGHDVLVLGVQGNRLENYQNWVSQSGSSSIKYTEARRSVCTYQVVSCAYFDIAFSSRYNVRLCLDADFASHVQELIREFEPQIIQTQLEGALEVLRHAEHEHVPVAHWIRDGFNPYNWLPFLSNDFAPPPHLTLANSRFVAQRLKERVSVDAKVIYPIVREIPLRHSRCKGPKGDILMVNPVSYKGGDLMFQVATQMKGTTFVVVPGWGTSVPDKWRALSNTIVFEHAIQNRSDLFTIAPIVVVPSQKGESASRVALEAQRCGLTVIASNHSGLAEVLGDTAILIDDFADPGSWINAIESMVADEKKRKELANLGFENSSRFSPSIIAPKIIYCYERMITTKGP